MLSVVYGRTRGEVSRMTWETRTWERSNTELQKSVKVLLAIADASKVEPRERWETSEQRKVNAAFLAAETITK